MKFKRKLLIDLSGFAHAAWHAYPYRVDKMGENCNMIHGVLSKIKRMERHYVWDEWAVIKDCPGGSVYRKSLYPDYKANRPEKDPDFARQYKLLLDCLEDLNVPLIDAIGEESDDIIGTIVHSDINNAYLVATYDKDLFQLVSDRVLVLNPNKGQEGIEVPFNLVDPDGVKMKTGVSPYFISDWLALMGDLVDNIPGVEGVGKKTAGILVNEYGDINAIIKACENKRDKISRKIIENKSILLLSKSLTQLKLDVNYKGSLGLTKNEPKSLKYKDFLNLPDSWCFFGNESNNLD